MMNNCSLITRTVYLLNLYIFSCEILLVRVLVFCVKAGGTVMGSRGRGVPFSLVRFFFFYFWTSLDGFGAPKFFFVKIGQKLMKIWPAGNFEGRGWSKGPERGLGPQKRILLKSAKNPWKYGRGAILKGGGGQKAQKVVWGPEKNFH